MADRVAGQKAGRDTRTTTRWSEEELAWLEARAAATGKKVGSVVRELVQVAMEARAAGLRPESTGSARRVRGGAAPSSPSGVAPSQPRDLMRDLQASLEPAAVAQRMRGQRVRLEVVVARMLDGGGQGPIPPARLADARRLIRVGRVRVSGSAVADAAMLVGPGEVEIVS